MKPLFRTTVTLSLLLSLQFLLTASFTPIYGGQCYGLHQHNDAMRSFRPTQTKQSQSRLFLQSLQELEDRYLEVASTNSVQPEIVYILMYNPGTDQEGVHTTEYPKDGSGAEVILGFEDLQNCMHFATALKENPNFPLEPIPTPAPLPQMKASVESMGMDIMVVPKMS